LINNVISVVIHLNQPIGYNIGQSASLRYGLTVGGGGGPAQNDLITFTNFWSTAARDRWSFTTVGTSYFTDRDVPSTNGGYPTNKSIYFRGNSDLTGDASNLNSAKITVVLSIMPEV